MCENSDTVFIHDIQKEEGGRKNSDRNGRRDRGRQKENFEFSNETRHRTSGGREEAGQASDPKPKFGGGGGSKWKNIEL
jgi:hypothetical protein